MQVVMKTGSLASKSTTPQTEIIGEMIENANNFLQTELISIMMENSKIPPYATNSKKEYLFIRGLNKEIKYFFDNLDQINNGLFETKNSNRIKCIMKRFLRAQEKGKLNNDISNLIFQADDIRNFININENFDLCYYFYDSDDDGKPFTGFKEIYDIFKMIFNQLKYEGSDYDDFKITDVVFPDTEYNYDVIDEF